MSSCLRVLIDGISSDWLPIKCGVPQRSLLESILFSLYVNDLPSVLETDNVNMYADDTAIYIDGTNQEDMVKCLSDKLVWVSKTQQFKLCNDCSYLEENKALIQWCI